MSARYTKWLPVIDGQLCTGCGQCVDVCTPKSLEMVEGKAVLMRPDSCGGDEHCIASCPTRAMRMEWLEWEGDKTQGLWRLATDLGEEDKK